MGKTPVWTAGLTDHPLPLLGPPPPLYIPLRPFCSSTRWCLTGLLKEWINYKHLHNSNLQVSCQLTSRQVAQRNIEHHVKSSIYNSTIFWIKLITLRSKRSRCTVGLGFLSFLMDAQSFSFLGNSSPQVLHFLKAMGACSPQAQQVCKDMHTY